MSAIAAYPTHADVNTRTPGCRGALLGVDTSCAIAGAVASNAITIATNAEVNCLRMV